ncbi:flavin reductase family protein [Paenalcaligenes hominis]|uniref:Flavin reductase (DIM6/NTAB) family NADH-FMN oxidoreductase RutF n=1 Tax=Paenalcaligenes hominis TaxID=643674 RepID=A0A1U9K0C4_9BURK|nr:flavin reductase family protein [Paenalcaligenes hominis]AQS51471.1 hypothetical protein PAEH1_07710 [Paenalcaligenes hominis]NJB65461.1 flavin reductase (DIM6/NTAB) family NADH-FMN oxidoreductase RutF [Paenalcaligenes hominis]GGE65699.1 oxidoreductase [Paenalcaligenes hominis]
MSSTHSLAVSSTDYKKAMRHLAGTPCIITASHQGQRSGLTASSVTSVAIDPAELLVCIKQTASAWPLIEQSGYFGVSILNYSQRHVAERFAGVGGLRAEQRYDGSEWIEHNGVWLLAQAPAALVCKVSEIIVRHSHAMVLGAVEYVHLTDSTDPALLYWQGQFVSLP